MKKYVKVQLGVADNFACTFVGFPSAQETVHTKIYRTGSLVLFELRMAPVILIFHEFCLVLVFCDVVILN